MVFTNLLVKTSIFSVFAVPFFILVIGVISIVDIGSLIDVVDPYINTMVSVIYFFPLGGWFLSLFVWWFTFEIWIMSFCFAIKVIFEWIPRWTS